MRCDVIAEGVVAAAREISLSVPLVVRLEGTNVDLGKKILSESGLPIMAAQDLDDAARKIVSTVKGGLWTPYRLEGGSSNSRLEADLKVVFVSTPLYLVLVLNVFRNNIIGNISC
jgi:hypothetical protein